MKRFQVLSSIVSCLLLLVSPLFVSVAQATKTSDNPLNFTILFTDFRFGQMSMYSPGQPVSFNLSLENPGSASYWGVDYVINFPAELSCTSASAPGNCSLSGNRFACHWDDVYANQTFNFVVNCQVRPDAVCGSKPRTQGSVTTMKAATQNQGYIDFAVKCQETPTPFPTSTPVPTIVPPTATYTPVWVPTIVPTDIPTPFPTFTSTWVPTATPYVTSTFTPTPYLTPTPYATPWYTPTVSGTPTYSHDVPACKDSQDNDQDGKVDYPADPGCDSPHDRDEGDQDCQTYSIQRNVIDRWGRSDGRPVTIRERVQILPQGEKLSCLKNAAYGHNSSCLQYDNFYSCNDYALRRHLRRETYVGRCYGASSLTQFLLSQACQHDRQSEECAQYLALNSYRSNDYPFGPETTGVVLSRQYNPETQVYVVDSNCQLIINPTDDQKYRSCPAAVITGYSYCQSGNRW